MVKTWHSHYTGREQVRNFRTGASDMIRESLSQGM
jgi:hypothetical protein